MKKLKIGLFILFILIATISAKDTYAATNSDMLISLGTGAYQITVYKTTTIDDIIRVLGEPKLVTESAFGGSAYTFYTDDNYNNYLYIETLSDGQIMSYGSVDETFKTNTYNYGDETPYSIGKALCGCFYSKDGTIGGAVFYNGTSLYDGNYSKIMDFYENNYRSNPIKYLKGLSQQGILMYNAASFKAGNKDTTPLVFNEDFFYINEQFKELGTSIREYMRDMELDKAYMKAIGTKTSVEISSPYYMLNPIMFADMVTDNKFTMFEEKNIGIFDYNIDTGYLTAIAVSKDAFVRSESIILTNEEINKRTEGRAEYERAMEYLKDDSPIYEIEPVCTIASSLVAGKLSESKANGILGYINAIRVAAGLPRFERSDAAYNVAQHKATLLSYRYQELGLDIDHSFEKPSGVSEDFYVMAMGNREGYAENVGITNENIRDNEMRGAINRYLDDSAEYPQTFGHRLALLSSLYRYFGFGISPYISVNEFNGSRYDYDDCIEAWPSKGITFMETLASPRFQWTARFVDKYLVLDTTTATIKCLNTNEVWEFTEYEKNNDRWFTCHYDNISSLNNKVIMYDSSIVPQPGYVYEITIHGLKNEDTNSIEDYTYRSVFEYADISNYPTTVNNLSIEIPENTDFKYDADNEAYMLPIGQEINLDVNLDESIVDKKVTWSSTNDKIKVTQNGIIYTDELLEEGETAVISVSYDGNSSITDEIFVKAYKKLDEVILDKSEMECLALEENLEEPSFSLYIDYIPSDATEVKSINWKIVSHMNPEISYDMTDEYIRNYVRLEKDPSDPRRVFVYAVTAEVGNNVYDIISEVQGISGVYKGQCELKINVPIDSLNIRVSSMGLVLAASVLDINYNEYNNSTFDMRAFIGPENTTYDKTTTWKIGNENVISLNNTSIDNATFNILKEGETTLTATSINGVSDIITVRINAYMTKVDLISDTNIGYCNSNVHPRTMQLTVNSEPSVATDVIKYSSDNPDVASVDESGLVTFLSPGTAKITAYSAENPQASDTIDLTVYSCVGRAALTTDKNVINKGENLKVNVLVEPENYSFKNEIEYKSSDDKVAIVDDDGNVTGVGAGEAKIIVTIPAEYTINGTNDIVLETKVTVKVPITDISLPQTKTMVANQTTTLEVELLPEDAFVNHTVKWESLNPEILVVDESSGEVTAKELGVGTVRATVTDDENGKEFIAEMIINVMDFIKGDMNKDGAVNSIDASLVIDRYKTRNISDEDYAIGDMDENNTLNAIDASLIIDLYKNNEAFN